MRLIQKSYNELQNGARAGRARGVADKMLVMITDQRKLWKWPWQEQKHRVKFLAHSRLPLEITIKESEGYDQAFKRVFGKEPILRLNFRKRKRGRRR